MVVVVHFDGLCEPVNPGGVAAYGFVVYRDGERLHAGRGVVGAGYLGDDVTNNVAEYTALIKALEWLVENGFAGEELVVRGDSQLVIRQLKGEYAVRSPRIAPLYSRVRELLRHFSSVELEWVPRELNAEADALSRAAYEEFLKEHPEASRIYSAGPSRASRCGGDGEPRKSDCAPAGRGRPGGGARSSRRRASPGTSGARGR